MSVNCLRNIISLSLSDIFWQAVKKTKYGLLLAEKMVKKGITKSVKMVYNNEKLAGQA